MQKTIKQLAEVFYKQAERELPLIIAGHKGADGDAISSSLALCEACKSLGFNARVLLDEPIPEHYHFIKGYETVEIFSEDYTLPEKFNLFILDCHEAPRLGKRSVIFEQAEKVFIMDHHECGPAFVPSEFAHIDPSRSATAEMAYFFIAALEELSSQKIIDVKIAELLTVGIYADTGSMGYSNTGSETYYAMYELAKFAVPTHEISENLFSSIPIAEARARGLALMKCRVECDGKLVWCFFTTRELLACGIDKSQTGAISSLLKKIAGTDLAIFMREDLNEDGSRDLNLSLRSSENINCQVLAEKLGGGGHQRASGATVAIEDDIYDTVEEVLVEARRSLNCRYCQDQENLQVVHAQP